MAYDQRIKDYTSNYAIFSRFIICSPIGTTNNFQKFFFNDTSVMFYPTAIYAHFVMATGKRAIGGTDSVDPNITGYNFTVKIGWKSPNFVDTAWVVYNSCFLNNYEGFVDRLPFSTPTYNWRGIGAACQPTLPFPMVAGVRAVESQTQVYINFYSQDTGPDPTINEIYQLGAIFYVEGIYTNASGRLYTTNSTTPTTYGGGQTTNYAYKPPTSPVTITNWWAYQLFYNRS